MKLTIRLIIFFVMIVIVFSLSAEDTSYKIVHQAKLAAEDTYGKTYWDNLVDRGQKLYIKPVYDNDYKDKISLISLPDLVKTDNDVPLEQYFKAHPEFLVEGKLFSPLKNGKERKNYWIEDCFFYDTKNGEAGLRVLNYFLMTNGSLQRTFYVHWDIAKNTITKAVLLMEYRQQSNKGDYEYTAVSINNIGYNYNSKLYYYLKTEDTMSVVQEGKYRKYLHPNNLKCSFHSISISENNKIASLETGSRNSYGIYNTELNVYFFPTYKDLGHVSEKMNPEGFLIDLSTGVYKKIESQRHSYWSDISAKNNILFEISSSAGKLNAYDILTGNKKGELYVGDAGEDRYRKFSVLDESSAAYYLMGKLVIIDINTFKIRKTITLAEQFKEFSGSSQVYILPDNKGIIVEARTIHNKTTGFLYYLK